jgi:GT2 family glycosyltransferase
VNKLVEKSVYIIIPVHNRKKITLNCLDNLEQSGDLCRFTVVVVDDGSTDGTSKEVTHVYPGVVVVKGDGNLWWTGAIRTGMEYAYQEGAEFYIWLNDDCLPGPGALQSLVRFLQEHPKSIAAPACYLSDQQTVVENGCRGRTRLTAPPGENLVVDSVAGYCVGLPKTLIDSIGFPDDQRFPHYGGDDMYLLKGTRSGFSTYILGNARVVLADMDQHTHDFSSYIKQRFLENLSFKSIFMNRKSRYNFRTQLNYFLEKYGLFGVFVFVLKTWNWMLQYCLIKYKRVY